ncbi:MAG: DUF2306 domain-containing protein [Pseudomonadota bacterium]
MTDIALPARTVAGKPGATAFRASVTAWFVTAAVGHGIFLAYILAVFFPPLSQHGLQGLEGLHLPAGFREGDTLGNLAAASHVLLAAVVIGGGPLQLVPAVRARWPVFHRWIGRSYALAAVVTSLGGLYMVWTRGTVGGMVNYIAISIDAVLIVVFAALAVRAAVQRRIAQHRRWALRLFMAASAVWFFRVGLMGWVMLTGGLGMDFDAFTGPFLLVLGFAQYGLPLAMLEWYFRCQARPDASARGLFTLTLCGLTVYMGIGIFVATMGMWLPRL